ncbi:MAG TPA: hypothetical protein VNI61_06950 [Gemmatimonadales bacterium]|nr:hypothetical protein [Gemmatimonadales bacterium]
MTAFPLAVLLVQAPGASAGLPLTVSPDRSLGTLRAQAAIHAPEGLQRAPRNSQRLQDLLLKDTRPGRTENEVLAAARVLRREAPFHLVR